MSSLLAVTIREYCGVLLAGTDEIHHSDAAREFIGQHGDVIGFHMEEIVEQYITRALKKQGTQPAAPFGQGVLFDLPAAITVADGVTKPLRVCTWADLEVGREYKQKNVADAQTALDTYDSEMSRLAPVMAGTDLTVAEAARLLASAA